ncbi:Holliday junction branch migration protein RuvA [Patescibacteria group bacterium]|nr:MAG: Holliday junction branch migration protein RuvA [Patescibacteria group bacterium]
MIATIEGAVAEKLAGSVVVELGGIGYEVVVSVADWGAAAIGSTTKFYVYEHIREDSHQLFGFNSRSDKELFILLLSVNGVGPKVAMQVMSAATGERLRAAIASGDSSLFKNVSGVGKKTAERIMVELKNKVEAGGEIGVELTGGGVGSEDPAYQALIGLGYKPAQAAAAVSSLPSEVTDEQERVRLALRNL